MGLPPTVGIGGTALEDNKLSYNLQQTYANKDTGYGASVSGRYRGSSGEVGMGYSYGGDNRQWNYSAQGSIVAHGQGITLGQPVRDAFAIVHIDDGDNVNVQNGRGIYTDAFGNAIVPSLTAYRHNTLTVNTQDRSDIDIDAATLDLVPTKGAAILATFDARVGRRALVALRHRGNRCRLAPSWRSITPPRLSVMRAKSTSPGSRDIPRSARSGERRTTNSAMGTSICRMAKPRELLTPRSIAAEAGVNAREYAG